MGAVSQQIVWILISMWYFKFSFHFVDWWGKRKSLNNFSIRLQQLNVSVAKCEKVQTFSECTVDDIYAHVHTFTCTCIFQIQNIPTSDQKSVYNVTKANISLHYKASVPTGYVNAPGRATQSRFIWAPPRVQWLNSHDSRHCFFLWVDKGKAVCRMAGRVVCVCACMMGIGVWGGVSDSHGDIKLYCMQKTNAPTISNVPPDVLRLSHTFSLFFGCLSKLP